MRVQGQSPSFKNVWHFVHRGFFWINLDIKILLLLITEDVGTSLNSAPEMSSLFVSP